jgi:hypothetical protein
MPRSVIVIAVLVFYALHQDFWFWREARPLVFGVLPIGLFYHAVYTVAVSLLVWGLVKVAWPSRLEADAADRASSESRSGSE